MPSSTTAQKSRACMSPPARTAGRRGYFPSRTTAWGLIVSISTGFLSCFNGCMDGQNLTAQESDWPFAKKLWKGKAGGSGSSRSPKEAQPFTLPCQMEVGSDGDERKRKADRNSFG